MKGQVLKLNKYFFPVGISPWREAVKNIFSEAVYPLDIQYEEVQDGTSLESYSWFEPIRSWADWMKLPVRDFDDKIKTTKGFVRLPTVVVCKDYDRVKYNRVLFPTKNNIWNRDNWICAYTGEKLNKDNVSVDHIIPVSKGGENTWLNLITSHKEINRQKADMDLKDFKHKLKYKPTVPKGGMVFPVLRPEWTKFIAESSAA